MAKVVKDVFTAYFKIILWKHTINEIDSLILAIEKFVLRMCQTTANQKSTAKLHIVLDQKSQFVR